MPKPTINLEIANTVARRMKGVIGIKSMESKEALLIKPAYLSIHTFGVKFDLDVAFLDSQLRVVATKCLKPKRFAGSLKSRAVLEAPAGSFEKWGIVVGSQLEVSSTTKIDEINIKTETSRSYKLDILN